MRDYRDRDGLERMLSMLDAQAQPPGLHVLSELPRAPLGTELEVASEHYQVFFPNKNSIKKKKTRKPTGDI